MVSNKTIAEIYGVSIRTVHDWTNKGLLPDYIEDSKMRWLHKVEKALTEREKPGRKQFTKTDIAKIRAMGENGIPQTVIATKFNVHYSTISRILSRERYKDVK